MTPSFLEQTNERRLPPGYSGDVLVWDIDKTYLDTAFSSVRGLLRIPIELAVDKLAIPGSVPLLRALRHGPGHDSAVVPLYFISGSPVQLRATIERKMILDGVDYDGITFKDQWGLLRAGRPRGIREQVGYKLRALLLYRRAIPDTARYLMFGDDVESDADAFCLYGEIVAGLRGEPLERRLTSHAVHPRDIEEVRLLLDGSPIHDDPVEKVFIHLTGGSDPARFKSPRVVATHSYLQAALVLASLGRVRTEAIAAVAKDLRLRHCPEYVIDHHLEDAERRLGVAAELTALARME